MMRRGKPYRFILLSSDGVLREKKYSPDGINVRGKLFDLIMERINDEKAY